VTASAAGRPPAAAERFGVLRPALLLTGGRLLAFGVAFLVPVVLARVLTIEQFGTYKQLFLVFATVFFVAQVGIANSLFYFLPRAPERAGRYAVNAALVLAASGAACALGLAAGAGALARAFHNPALAPLIGPLGVFLAAMLVAAPLEIVLIARHRYRAAALAYALSDLLRAGLLVVPAVVTGDLAWLVAGAIAFGLARVVALAVHLRRGLGAAPRPDGALLREQLAYSVPFGLAVLVATAQTHLHEYVVAHRFDAATFAIYAVGCLQIPLVDFVATPAGDVMMVRMAEASREGRADRLLATWHDTVASLALLFVPLVGLLVLGSRELITLLFTPTYAAAAPLFALGSTAILLVPLMTDGVLRVFARTRFLLGVHLLQLAVTAACIGPFLSRWGLAGAIGVTLVAVAVGRLVALGETRRRLQVGWRRLLPWGALGRIAGAGAVAFLAGRAALALSGLSGLPALALLGAVFCTVDYLLVVAGGVAPGPRELAEPLRRRLSRQLPALERSR
jgi:O-antigen/teichoic acid export membrane protein